MPSPVFAAQVKADNEVWEAVVGDQPVYEFLANAGAVYLDAGAYRLGQWYRERAREMYS